MQRNVWNDFVSWQTRRLNNSPKYLLHFKEEELKSVGELSKVSPQNCSEMLVLGTYWKTWYSLRSITKWTKACDKRLCRLISYIHHTCEYKQYCYVGNTAKQCRLGLSQDSDFAGDLEDSKSTSGGTLCVFGSHTFVPISWMCKKQTFVSRSSAESEIISLDAGLRLGGIPALDLWDLIVAVLGNTTQNRIERGDPLLDKREVCSPPHESNLREWSMLWIIDFIPQTSSLRIKKLCCMCSKTMKQWSRWSLKEGAQQGNMFPEPKELLLIGYLIESIWTPKSKSSTSTPKTNLPTLQPRETSHVMNGIIFCVCLTSAISVLQIVLKWCRKERKKIQVKKESQRNRSRWWIWSRDAAKGFLMCWPPLHQKAQGKPHMRVNFLWARELSSIPEQGDLLRTLTHQATQSGMLIRLGLLKSGNLMNWWKLEQGDLLYSHSTRTDSLLKTIIWTLTPKQNQKCR